MAAHRLKEDGDRAHVLAERTVVLEGECQRDSNQAVGCVAYDERPEHDSFDVADVRQEEHRDKHQRGNKGEVANPAERPTGVLRRLARQEVQHHGRPACVAAPAAAKDGRAEYLRYGLVDGRGLKRSGEQVIPKAFDLHVLLANKGLSNTFGG